jgi:hypothetical protein
VKQAAASGVADFRAQFEAAKQQARQAFAEQKAEAEQERQKPKRSRDNDGRGWSR